MVRSIHAFVESKQEFANWIKNRIEKYGFVENTDYIMLPKTGELENKGLQGKIEYFVTFSENSEKGRPRLEYALTLDKTSLLGLRNVLSGTNLWETKIISRFLKKGSGKINDL